MTIAHTNPSLLEPNMAVPDIARTPTVAALKAKSPAAPSIFHESWWLDIATGGNWSKARVMHGNQVLGEMPYYIARKGLWRVCTLPPLTRALGPAIAPMGLGPAHELRHRLHVTSQLVEQLPDCDNFFQIFDYHVQDALAFAVRGFSVSARYTFQIPSSCATTEVWTRMDSKIRNSIRSAGKAVKVRPIDLPSEFLRFYEANLASRSRANAYGTSVMKALVHAFLDRRAGRLLGAYDSNDKLVGAIGLVWDSHTMYYLLTTRAKDSHSGTISLLLWTAIQEAIDRGLTFDFDGFAGASAFNFLNGFGGVLKQRLGVERSSTAYSLARTLKRKAAAQANRTFAPQL